jgi:hypothetical protein
LLQLYGSKEIPLSAEHMTRVARRQGFNFSEGEIRDALFFLKGQRICEELVDPVTGEVRHRITSQGMLQWEGRLF